MSFGVQHKVFVVSLDLVLDVVSHQALSSGGGDEVFAARDPHLDRTPKNHWQWDFPETEKRVATSVSSRLVPVTQSRDFLKPAILIDPVNMKTGQQFSVPHERPHRREPQICCKVWIDFGICSPTFARVNQFKARSARGLKGNKNQHLVSLLDSLTRTRAWEQMNLTNLRPGPSVHSAWSRFNISLMILIPYFCIFYI